MNSKLSEAYKLVEFFTATTMDYKEVKKGLCEDEKFIQIISDKTSNKDGNTAGAIAVTIIFVSIMGSIVALAYINQK